jgi:hypothetical protein
VIAVRPQPLLTALVLAALGCGRPYQLAPVSGKVTLDGRPLPGAWVHFAPVATEANLAPGPTSHGRTDAEGRFTVRVSPEEGGAAVGRSRVFITTLGEGPADQPDAGVPAPRDRVPRKYNQETTLVFEVPAGGTDQADFDLTSE